MMKYVRITKILIAEKIEHIDSHIVRRQVPAKPGDVVRKNKPKNNYSHKSEQRSVDNIAAPVVIWSAPAKPEDEVREHNQDDRLPR